MVLERQKSFIKPGRLLYSWGLWRVADFVCPSKGIEIFNLGAKTIYFLIDNSPKINDFIDYYERDSQLSRLALLSVDFYRWTDRKVSKQPYFKHPFYTDYLCFEMLDERNEIINTESDKRVFLGAALLHDAIEIKRKNHEQFTEKDLLKQLIQSGINKDEARKIVVIVSFLTPSKKDNSKLSSEQWKNKKREDFNRIMNQEPSEELPLDLLEMAKQIKIADEMANLRETVEDVKSGNDGPDKEVYDHKSFEERVAVFEERIGIITDKYPGHPLLSQLQSDLDFLKGCLHSS